jgi:hypothetical protein
MERNYPASLFYDIPTGGARPNEEFERPNTYLDKLGAQRAEHPPVNWDDQPAKLGITPNILNDPAFSQYDLSQLRGFKQDPKLRDKTDLGIASSPSTAYGYTYIPDKSPYDPNKVYIRDYGELGIGNLKMATGPGAEQTKQGNINKEIASTIAHEFRHNIFDEPGYSDILDKAYDKLGGTMGRHEIEEYVNRAADAELIPGDWDWAEFDIPKSLQQHQKAFNARQLSMYDSPPINTTDIFNQAAKEFFKRVKYNKMSKAQKQTQMQKTIQQAEAAAAAKAKADAAAQAQAQASQRQADQARISRAYREETGGQAGSYAPGGGSGAHAADASGSTYSDPFDPGGGEARGGFIDGTNRRRNYLDGGLIDFFRYGGFIG